MAKRLSSQCKCGSGDKAIHEVGKCPEVNAAVARMNGFDPDKAREKTIRENGYKVVPSPTSNTQAPKIKAPWEK